MMPWVGLMDVSYLGGLASGYIAPRALKTTKRPIQERPGVMDGRVVPPVQLAPGGVDHESVLAWLASTKPEGQEPHPERCG